MPIFSMNIKEYNGGVEHLHEIPLLARSQAAAEAFAKDYVKTFYEAPGGETVIAHLSPDGSPFYSLLGGPIWKLDGIYPQTTISGIDVVRDESIEFTLTPYRRRKRSASQRSH